MNKKVTKKVTKTVKRSKSTKSVSRPKEGFKPKGKRASKTTWEAFLKNKDSVDALKKSWKSKNPEEYYKRTIKRLSKKYSNKK